jgi:hypothetical protein
MLSHNNYILVELLEFDTWDQGVMYWQFELLKSDSPGDQAQHFNI